MWSQISRDQTHCRSWSPCTVEQFNYTLSLSLSFLADREFIWAGFWQGFALFYLCRQKGNKNFVTINKNLHSIRSRAWRITLPFIEKEKKDTVNTCSVRKFKTPKDTMICFPDVYLVLLPKVKRFHKGRACAFVGYPVSYDILPLTILISLFLVLIFQTIKETTNYNLSPG